MKPPIVMQTDFGRDESVATMIGVCKCVDDELRIFDGNHSIPPFNTYVASTDLLYLADFWPEGTVFVSVVDPGVGTSRRGSVVLLENGRYVVSPDNGSLTHVAKEIGIKAIREIDMSVNRWPSTKSCDIFHGRDVFAYTAARLASGVIDFAGVGPEYPVGEVVVIEYDEPACQDGAFTGIIQSAHPHFGLIDSNIPMSMVEEKGLAFGDWFDVTIRFGDEVKYHEKVEYQQSFGYVAVGAPILYTSSSLQMEIALRNDNMVEKYGISAGPDWHIRIQKI